MRLSFSRGGRRWRQSGPPSAQTRGPKRARPYWAFSSRPGPARWTQRPSGSGVGLTPGHVTPLPPPLFYTRIPPTLSGLTHQGSGGVRSCPPPLRVTLPPGDEPTRPASPTCRHSSGLPTHLALQFGTLRSLLCDQFTHQVLIVLGFLFLNPSHLSELQLRGPVVLTALRWKALSHKPHPGKPVFFFLILMKN